MQVSVSGKTYYAAFDPTATDFFEIHPDVPKPDGRKAGRGTTWEFGELNDDHVFTILDHMETTASALLATVDKEKRASGYAIEKDWLRLMTSAEPREPGYYLDYRGHGWCKTEKGWIYVRRSINGRGVPADPRNTPQRWLDMGRRGPFLFAGKTHPSKSWLKVD